MGRTVRLAQRKRSFGGGRLDSDPTFAKLKRLYSMSFRCRRAALCLIVLLLSPSGCGRTPRAAPQSAPADVPATPAPALESVQINGVPHVRQKPDFCGEAAAASYFRKLGHPVSQDDVFNASGMDPSRGMGATTRELKTALETLGTAVGPVWMRADPAHAARDLKAHFASLHADLQRGVPSIVCMRYDERPNTTEHFRLILGYDADTDEILYHEPAEDNAGYRRMSRTRLLSLWPLKYQKDNWTIIRLRMQVNEFRKPKPRAGFSAAAYAQHVLALRKRLPQGFSVVIEPPFVVVGGSGAARVKAQAESTVKFAVSHLKRQFFTRDPKRILNVWLFKDKTSYEKHTRAFWGSVPDTPYGYYSSTEGALVMNIATGGGTLVHEIVHPFVEANFPGAPAWLNEGLGSLYEQSARRNGRIVGLTNWRLAGLQTAIRNGPIPSFRALSHTTSHQFYEQDPGTNYAQARYLMYYLQEHGLLEKFYHSFYRNRQADPTGYQTLRSVLGEPDMKKFQRRWQAYVLGLRFR